jgi:predicted kinase
MSTSIIYIFFGLIASGKSTLAELFAARHQYPSYNTDRVRKELAGLAANERRHDSMGQGIYTPEFTEKTYQAMLDHTERDLKVGVEGVVLDGSYSRRVDRAKVLELAGRLGVAARFILCSCSDREVKHRLDLRAKDPNAVSDGRWDIYVRQKDNFESPGELGPDHFLQLATEAEPDQLVNRLDTLLKQ